jgi:hypothetical protein
MNSIWNAEKKTARFVEVKGPGDSLMETQKVLRIMPYWLCH